MNPSARLARNKRLKNMTIAELKGLLKITNAIIKEKQGKTLIDEKGGKQ
jgi:hypothetical protein|tara:strand:- start:299 stop:445 length:147 start_codon:yes stop_codon:yes gene_type:complete